MAGKLSLSYCNALEYSTGVDPSDGKYDIFTAENTQVYWYYGQNFQAVKFPPENY